MTIVYKADTHYIFVTWLSRMWYSAVFYLYY